MRKAQSAMEYLMTYGWAILIVIIVAAALFALGVFNPSTYTGRAATGFGELGAPADWQYAASTGTPATSTFTVVLKNQVGQGITVSNVTTVQGCYDATSTPISAGSTASFGITGCTPKSKGESYSETVTVTYAVAGGLARTASGTLTGTVA
jgi:hypothetical protein